MQNSHSTLSIWAIAKHIIRICSFYKFVHFKLLLMMSVIRIFLYSSKIALSSVSYQTLSLEKYLHSLKGFVPAAARWSLLKSVYHSFWSKVECIWTSSHLIIREAYLIIKLNISVTSRQHWSPQSSQLHKCSIRHSFATTSTISLFLWTLTSLTNAVYFLSHLINNQ